MTYLLHHMEQISSSARTIGELSFASPGVFTNAMLGNHEITNLIRDTEPHERALFSVSSNDTSLLAQQRPSRRNTASSLEKNREYISSRQIPRKHSAVARVLGPDMLQEIEAYRGHTIMRTRGAPGRVNIEVLLQGAEKLCAVYPVAGAPEKIASLRKRYGQVTESVALYEEIVASQSAKLDRMNKVLDRDEEYNESEDLVIPAKASHDVPLITDEQLRSEEQEIQELERKKFALDERVASMEKDLGGLMG